jgi:hypothetical protein
LALRELWISGVWGAVTRGKEPPCPTGQQWRELLRHTTPKQRSGDSWAAEQQRATEALFAQHVIPNDRFPETLLWQGRRLVARDIENCVDSHTLSEIIWELYEINFRLELLALDRAVNPAAWVVPAGGDFTSLVRWQQVCSVFPDSRVIVDGVPTTNAGFSAEILEHRLPSLRALQALLTTWPKSDQGPYYMAMGLSLGEDTSPGVASTVELALASCYCQAYFSYFGRAALTPRGVPIQRHF